MSRISRKLERLMSAVSFAEEGDFRSADEILKEKRGVLIAIRGSKSDAQALRYALNTCKRIGAELHILSLAPPSGDDLLSRYGEKLKKEGVQYRVIRRGGCLKKEIIDYTRAEKDVLFVVIGSEEDLDGNCRRKEQRLIDAWQRLRCPLVVVTEAAQV